MTIHRTIGLVLMVTGCLYAGFWMMALHEWNGGKRLPAGSLTKEAFEKNCPVLTIVFRCWDFRPFDKDQNEEDLMRLRPGVTFAKRMTAHSIVGGLLFCGGIGSIVVGHIRSRRRSGHGA